ncbi:hypothetical protein [Levilactobacillus tujiorum]|uniref:hypothetical protein n=1 Tax=Levilactobacillus tujiorum TaxID=2912243 RepID=UPI0014564FEA|nr:hypothetical protein [Levilactobacillus tujiorum]NLR31891.1 hypothetical protein [Levilactobacillus tujiorum]
MELGTWSDWFEAVSELLAVVVALFLPVFQERKRKRETRLRVNQNIRRLTLDLLANPQRDMQWKTDFHSLQTLLRLYSSLMTDELGEPIVAIGEKLLMAVEQKVPDQQTIDHQLAALAKCE